MGNGVCDLEYDGDAIIPFAFGKALLSSELYHELHRECKGFYFNATSGKHIQLAC